MSNKESVVLLTWTPPRPFVIHLPQSGGLLAAVANSASATAVVTPEQMKAAMAEHKPLLIIPGTNEYPAAMWELVKGHPSVRSHIADGNLILQTKVALGQKPAEGEKPDAPATKLPGSLTNLDPAKARELADNCDNLEILERWLKQETLNGSRTSVVDILRGKIDQVKETEARFTGSGAEAQ